ncbi:hypothetical protein EDD85DRAFT_102687 [Armillaria nabsnona]|nr:hypothetical protein EDD85DRAFT_102687 [Armillaria nabsnona]
MCCRKGTAGSGRSIYWHLFSMMVITDMGIFICYAIRGCSSQKVVLMALSNIFIAIIMRRSWLSVSSFIVACAVPQSQVLSYAGIRLKLTPSIDGLSEFVNSLQEYVITEDFTPVQRLSGRSS